MGNTSRKIVSIGISIMTLVPVVAWIAYSIRGKQFALRDRLRKADAIIVLAGTRGNIQFLNGKIRTGVHLYHQGWAPHLIFTGKFSAKVTDTPTLFELEELQQAGIKFSVVLADCLYGESIGFIRALQRLKLNYVLAIRSDHACRIPAEQKGLSQGRILRLRQDDNTHPLTT